VLKSRDVREGTRALIRLRRRHAALKIDLSTADVVCVITVSLPTPQQRPTSVIHEPKLTRSNTRGVLSATTRANSSADTRAVRTIGDASDIVDKGTLGDAVVDALVDAVATGSVFELSPSANLYTSFQEITQKALHPTSIAKRR
jgi:hypothetical protein